MSSGTFHRVALFRTDVLEIVLSPFSGVLRLIGFHICKRTPEDGDSTFSETLVPNSVTRYIVPEDMYNGHCRESIPEDRVLRTLIIPTATSYGNLIHPFIH
jgi:hypothetical protein